MYKLLILVLAIAMLALFGCAAVGTSVDRSDKQSIDQQQYCIRSLPFQGASCDCPAPDPFSTNCSAFSG